jgi:hypothetical protein
VYVNKKTPKKQLFFEYFAVFVFLLSNSKDETVMKNLVVTLAAGVLLLLFLVAGCASSVVGINYIRNAELHEDGRLSFRFYNSSKRSVIALSVTYALSDSETGDFIEKSFHIVCPEPVRSGWAAEIFLPGISSDTENDTAEESSWYIDFIGITAMEYDEGYSSEAE